MTLAILLAATACVWDGSPLEPLPRRVREMFGMVREAKPCSAGELPEGVRRGLASHLHQQELEIADPGQPWASGCIPMKDRPRHQLLFVGSAGDTWLVYYRSGGIGVTRSAVVIRAGEGRVEWHGRCAPGKPKGRGTMGPWSCVE